MDHFFKNSDDNDDIMDFNEKISLDELYDRKREIEINRMNIYRKILRRIHNKIKTVSRQNCDTFFFYVIPEFIFGIPRYNVNTCTSFIIEKLEENGFIVKYTHPNLLFISWDHYIPAYKREQIKKETGVVVDGFGNIIKKKKEEETPSLTFSNDKKNKNQEKSIKDSEFKDVKKYKPSGIYNMDLMQKIKDKLE
tara:strand:- start:1703 stop:2284 length:582 start_codon:yes stop_codon:yes gene_type:complete